MDKRYMLSPLARRRRQIIDDVEHMISFATGALFMVVVRAFLRALELI